MRMSLVLGSCRFLSVGAIRPIVVGVVRGTGVSFWHWRSFRLFVLFWHASKKRAQSVGRAAGTTARRSRARLPRKEAARQTGIWLRTVEKWAARPLLSAQVPWRYLPLLPVRVVLELRRGR